MKLSSIKLPVDYRTLDWTKGETARVRNEYAWLQGGLCYWCEKPLSQPPPAEITELRIHWDLFPENFMKNPVHLQHNHETHMTEGAVHAYCNAVMWQYHDR